MIERRASGVQSIICIHCRRKNNLDLKRDGATPMEGAPDLVSLPNRGKQPLFSGFRSGLCRRLALEFDKNSLGGFIGEILRQMGASGCPLCFTGLARLFLGFPIGKSHFDTQIREVNDHQVGVRVHDGFFVRAVLKTQNPDFSILRYESLVLRVNLDRVLPHYHGSC
jgi:hypothetical protein